MNNTILFIDDEPDILAIVTFRLKKLGYRVITAENGKIGLEIIKKEHPALIFLDLLMPEMDGYHVCKILKSDKELQDIPVILFTAVEDNRAQNAVSEVGADGILEKPYEPEQLLEIVKRYI